MDSLVITLLIVFAGVVLITPIARKARIPVIAAEILFGIIIGKSLFNLVPEHLTIDFFSSFGLTYLMFLAGMETNFGMMRLAFALIFLLGAVSIRLGVYSIIGAFIAGLLISEILPRATLEEEKLQSFGYGFFIPLFFILTGAQVNLAAVFSQLSNIAILLVIVAVGLLSKVAGVTIASRLSGLDMRKSTAFGLFHSARLSLIDEGMFAILIILAIVSATVAPALGKQILAKPQKAK